jgi:uncharacterized protein YjbI with pentapeptide repeats
MANPEHLAILKQGVEQWNKWREEHPDMRPDLSGAELKHTRLTEADLRGVNLTSANLESSVADGSSFRRADLTLAVMNLASLNGADLYRANLEEAELEGAHLRGADLEGVDLSRAHLIGADLSEGVDLRSAKLEGTNLTHADLRGARLSFSILSGTIVDGTDFTGAQVLGTIFARIDLSHAKGPDALEHWGSCSVGTEALYESSGKVPEVFLRRCGLSEWEIEAARLYDPGLSTTDTAVISSRLIDCRNRQPFAYHSCFISYSTKDQEFANQLHGDLRKTGVRCWFAPHESWAGGRFTSR